MDVHLRFGMHRNAPILREHHDLIDGLVVPAHILAYQRPSTSVFVSAMAALGVPYVIDPMSYYVQQEGRFHRREPDGDPEARPSLAKLYSEVLDERLLQSLLNEDDDIEHEEVEQVLPNLVEKCVAFQRQAVIEGAELSSATKYLRKYAAADASAPRLIVPPYFRFSDVGSPWYDLNVEAIALAEAIADEVPVAPVVCTSLEGLGDGTQIAQDLERFDSVFLWVDNFHENGVSAGQIQALRGAVAALNAEGLDVEILYGGYLMMLLAPEGVSAVSHGILYTQHKEVSLGPSGGGVAERFYLPGIHQFRSLSQTDLILHRHPELMPSTPICDEILAGDPDNIIHFADDPELLRIHFLQARAQEAEHCVPELDREEEAAQLMDAFEAYDESFRQFRNPDAIVTAARMPGLSFLREWAEGLS